MICVLCGSSLHQNLDLSNGPQILGYKCKSCGTEWLIKENKNFENWSVRHTRALEQRVQTLELQIKQLIKANNELAAWQKSLK